MEAAWGHEARAYYPNLRVSVAYATNREQALSEEADLYITNIDAIKWLDKWKGLGKFLKQVNYVIVDEATAYKHRTSNRSKAAARVIPKIPFRRLLSGTPTANTVLDAWHQAFLLDGGQRLGRSFFAYRMAACHPEQNGPRAEHIKWVDKPGAEEAIAAMLSDISVRHEFEQCMDIPPNHRYSVMFELPKRLRQTYEQMLEAGLLTLEETGEVIDGVNAAAVRQKLLQICSGRAYGTERNVVKLDTKRYELIADLVEARKHSVTFFVWHHQRDALREIFDARGITYELIDGTVPNRKRADLVERYQAGEFQTLLLHPDTGAHGLTLTRGTAVICASPIWEADLIEQMLHRVFRGGQTQRTETLFVCAADTIEEEMYARVFDKERRMRNFLDVLKEAVHVQPSG